MLYCDKCKISLTGAHKQCPLCQADLTGAPETTGTELPAFPLGEGPHYVLLRLIALATVAAAAVCVAVNMSVGGDWWSAFVVSGIASLWLTFGVVVKKKENLTKSILWQAFVISLLALAWDWWTGFHGWSIDYVLPILLTCSLIAMSVTARLMRLRVEDYILYLVLDGLCGLIPLILVLSGAVNVVYPSAVCVAASVIFLAALLLFEGKALRDEMVRRLHL